MNQIRDRKQACHFLQLHICSIVCLHVNVLFYFLHVSVFQSQAKYCILQKWKGRKPTRSNRVDILGKINQMNLQCVMHTQGTSCTLEIVN